MPLYRKNITLESCLALAHLNWAWFAVKYEFECYDLCFPSKTKLEIRF